MESVKKIGIWGFGIVGRSAVKHCTSQGYTIELMDKNAPAADDKKFLDDHHVTFVPQENLSDFLNRHTHILASPGIDLTPYPEHAHKWVTELDIVQEHFKKPTFAVTGSVGKTTVTHLLSKLIEQPKLRLWTGGNIGNGMLDLLQEADEYDAALIEVSSFQLEQCKTFAPHLAIWTNLYPNHLDRHKTEKNYFLAKKKILQFQQSHHKALLPLSLKTSIDGTVHSDVAYFSAQAPTEAERAACKTLYFIEDTNIVCTDFGSPEVIATLADLPDITFAENWLIIISALHQLGLSTYDVAQKLSVANLPAHRLEKVATINTIDFYNDSKSTLPASTLAALAKLRGKKIHLFLGGKGKGIDRTELIKELKNHCVVVYSFGAEAELLKTICDAQKQPCTSFPDLDTAFAACVQAAQPHEQVLFSPAGASYDLFKNFEERGAYFKKLVEKFEERCAVMQTSPHLV